MNQKIVATPHAEVVPYSYYVPALIAAAGESAARRYVEFFTANISNDGTRATYNNAVQQFCDFCQVQCIRLEQVTPIVVAGYLVAAKRGLSNPRNPNGLSDPTIKLHLSAIRMLFDYLVLGHIINVNPAAAVRGPKHVVKKGKTPVLTAEEARQLLDSIDTETIIGLRDRALIGVMVFSFARVSAVVGMNMEDYYPQGRRMWFRLHEKGGKHHEVPVHHKAEELVDAYLKHTQRDHQKDTPLFCTVSRNGELTTNRMHRVDVLRMIKRRAAASNLPSRICCHTFRATGITAYLSNKGSLEHAQRIAAHESANTTKLYDRTGDTISLDEIERIVI